MTLKPRSLEDRRNTMRRITLFVVALMVSFALPVMAQAPDALQIRQERAQAELDVPKLVEVLELKPGMTIADVGAGGGAVTVVLGKWIGSGQVLATDINPRTLQTIRDYVEKEGLKNVRVIEGAAASTNLPAACCDAIVMRDVYHHITAIDAFNKSLLESVKPGGRVAIIDFVARPKSALPEGVPANRGGHGIPSAVVVDELKAAGFTYLRTIDNWPPGDKSPVYHLSLFQR
jgi:ubiquinone/menaquinone biosynthesis C-methylase UbiE